MYGSALTGCSENGLFQENMPASFTVSCHISMGVSPVKEYGNSPEFVQIVLAKKTNYAKLYLTVSF